MEILAGRTLNPTLTAHRLHVSRAARPAAKPTDAQTIRTPVESLQRLVRQRPGALDAAWARDYLKTDVHITLDAERLDPAMLDVVTRRQAWQFQVLPLRRERHTLLVVTTACSLVRAARFAHHGFTEPVRVLVANEVAFRRYLRAYYPWPSLDVVV